MKLRFTRRAAQDIAEIADFIGEQDSAAAQRVRANILDSLEILTLYPRIGRRQSIRDVRKFVTPRYGYVIYYLADDTAGEIVALTIRHPAWEPFE